MKLAEYQMLLKRSNSIHGTASERKQWQQEFGRRTASDPVSGTVFVPVFFGSGMRRQEAVEFVVARKHISKREAKRLIKASRRETANGQEAFTDLDVAHAMGADRVGMGSCTDYAVCESDLDAPESCDISTSAGTGWRRA